MRNTSGQFGVKSVFTDFVESSAANEKFERITLKENESTKFRRSGEVGFFIVASGLLKLEVLKPTPRILRLCTQGDVAGYGVWASAISAGSYQLTAVKDSELQFWRRETFEAQRRSSPELNEMILEQLVQTLLHKDERIAWLEASSADERIASLLLWMATKFGVRSSSGTLIDVDLGREALAQLAGTSIVTFARTIGTFVDRGLIQRRRWKLQITNAESLKAVANGG